MGRGNDRCNDVRCGGYGSLGSIPVFFLRYRGKRLTTSGAPATMLPARTAKQTKPQRPRSENDQMKNRQSKIENFPFVI